VTDVTNTENQDVAQLSAADEQVLRELTERARTGGLQLTGEGGLLGKLTKMVVEGALEGELDDHLGYGKHDPAGRDGGNSRNGHRAKTVLTDTGPVEITVPRDRDSSFEPKIVAKRQRRLTGVDDMVISLSAKGLTHGEIAAHLAEVYGAEVSKQTISTITDRVMEGMAEWQGRILDPVYAVVFIDAINVKIREGQVANRPVYLALGVTVDGERDVLGLWAGEHGDGEGAKYWLRVLSEIKNRGVRDVCMLVCDGLKGLPDAVSAVWEKTIVQTCIVHLLRNSFKYASKRDWAQIAKDLKPVYTAASETEALDRFADFSGRWEKRYPAIIRLWENAWAEFVPFLAFDREIRTVICTTNAIESINARLRRAVNARGHFLSVTWNQTCRAISPGTVSPVTEEQCWAPSYLRRSGPCWAATMPRPGGCGSGPIWGGHRARSTPMPVAWPSIWRSASGKASTRSWRPGRMSRCSFASSPADRAAMVATWCRSTLGPGCPTPRFSSGWSRSGCSMTTSLRKACASPTRSGAGSSRRAAASEAWSGG
jgi:transposase-like protein